jgi:hypothetical protein
MNRTVRLLPELSEGLSRTERLLVWVVYGVGLIIAVSVAVAVLWSVVADADALVGAGGAWMLLVSSFLRSLGYTPY